MNQKPIYLKNKYLNIPKGTRFDIYTQSYNMFDLNYIYCVVYKKQDFVIPDEHISFEEKYNLSKKDITEVLLKNALELIQKAEQELFDNSIVSGTNAYREFLEANGVIIDRPKQYRLCKDCKKEIESSIYCDACIWSHEPGY